MDDLAPLPSTFDAGLSPQQSPQADLSLTLESGAPLFGRDVNTASPPAYDDLESRSGTPPAGPADLIQEQDDAMTGVETVYDEGVAVEDSEEVMGGLEEEEGDRPAPEAELWGFLAQLQGTKEDGYNEDEEQEDEPIEDKEEREAGTSSLSFVASNVTAATITELIPALSSPLSDLPELPNMLPTSPETPSPKLRSALPDTLDDIPSIDSVFAPIGSAAKGPLPGVRSTIAGVKRARTESTDTAKGLAPRTDVPPPTSTLASYSNGRVAAHPYPRPHSHDPISARSSLTPAPSEVDARTGTSELHIPRAILSSCLDNNKKRRVTGKTSGAGRDAKGSAEAPRPGRELASCSLQSGAKLTSGLMNDAQIRDYLLGKDKEVQLAACLRQRYANWGKCTQCVSKVGGDSCRFRDYRVFK